jgi:hypothetical protein
MAKKNKFGLTRNIPDPVKRAVRQRCGYGCVICGLSLYDYDHIDPPFEEAREHLPDDICLLCPTHHVRKSKGLISAADVRRAYGGQVMMSVDDLDDGRPSLSGFFFRHQRPADARDCSQ